MRVLVCGGRNYKDYETLFRELDEVAKSHKWITIIQGGASGADALACEWAKINRGVDCLTYRANWVKHGRAAGPIRNSQMLKDGKPDLVLAFPGGHGTADMVAKAKAVGVTVIEIGAPHV